MVLGPNNSLVKQIAQQKSKEGGRLHREDVRQVLLHLGMQAYEYLGPCIHALMRTIKNSIPQPLNEQEKRLFEHMHEIQPYYGNLPATMLADRMEDIQRAVLAIWHEPHDQGHVRVLHRLLYYYEEMSRNRRMADLQSKKRRAGQKPKNTPSTPAGADSVDGDTNKGAAIKHDPPSFVPAKGGESEFIENKHGATHREDDPFPIIAEHIRELGAIECSAGCLNWEYYREGESDSVVKIHLRCECGQIAGTISLSLDEFAEHGEKVLGWQRRKPRNSSIDGEKAGDES